MIVIVVQFITGLIALASLVANLVFHGRVTTVCAVLTRVLSGPVNSSISRPCGTCFARVASTSTDFIFLSYSHL